MCNGSKLMSRATHCKRVSSTSKARIVQSRSFPCAVRENLAPMDFFHCFSIAKMFFYLLPSKVFRISPASIYPMSCIFTEHSYCIKIQIALGLHVAEEFVRAAKFSTRQVFQLVGLLPRGDGHEQASVRVLFRVGFFFFERTAAKHKNFYLAMLL